jgi:hypothetical protein
MIKMQWPSIMKTPNHRTPYSKERKQRLNADYNQTTNKQPFNTTRNRMQIKK